MKRVTLLILTRLCYLTTLMIALSSAQVQLSTQLGSKLWLEGNSTIHEYSAKASELSGKIVIDSTLFAEGKGNPSKFFQHAEITIPVKKLLSGNEKLDNNMYDALKADDHPDITYHMTTDSIVSETNGDSLTVRATGKLTVAGKENSIDVTLTLLRHADSTLSIKGSKDLLMTDFGIDPPSMMFGVLKTDNKVVILFDLLLKTR